MVARPQPAALTLRVAPAQTLSSSDGAMSQLLLTQATTTRSTMTDRVKRLTMITLMTIVLRKGGPTLRGHHNRCARANATFHPSAMAMERTEHYSRYKRQMEPSR